MIKPMQPDNQTPTPSAPPGGQFDSSQFDFIMNPQKPAKKSLLPPTSPKTRLMVYISLGIIGVLLIIILASSLFGGSSSGTEQVVTIARQQNEIIRIAEQGNKKAGSLQTKKLAAITKSTVTTDQKNTLAYLEKQKKKLKDKDLRLFQDKEVDTDLANAERNGRFDEVFSRIILEKLTEYKSTMQTAYENVGPNGKELLDRQFKSVDLILKDNKPTATP
jgi:flagellar basal body-associated protein FliL